MDVVGVMCMGDDAERASPVTAVSKDLSESLGSRAVLTDGI